MATIVLICIIFILLITLFLIKSTKKPQNFAPGPIWLPFVGSTPILKKRIKQTGGLHLAAIELAKDFNSNIIGLKLGGENVILVQGYENVRRVLTTEEYEGRPDNFFIRLRSMGTRKGITFSDGKFWHEQRSFVTRHLRDVGFGKKQMEVKIYDELCQLIQEIEHNSGVINMANFFSPSVLSILWNLTAGRSLERDDPTLIKLINLLGERSKVLDMAGGILNQFPWLRFIAPEFTGYNLLRKVNEELKKFLMEVIEEHYLSYTDDSTDLIYAFLKEMKAQNGKNSTFTDDQLMMICLDLFIAGALTTNATLTLIFYQLLFRPDIAERLQKEIDAVIPSSRMPELSDRKNLPYTEAFLTEIRRVYPITVFAGPRRVLKDTVLENYNVPKETSVLINIWSVHMDKEYWKNPEEFEPERFIDDDGKFCPNERVLNFGLGRRRCPGEVLARSCIFLFTTGILQKYDISPNTCLSKMKINVNLIMSPDAYSIRFTRR